MSRTFPDYLFSTTSVKDIHLSLLLDGCCLLRGALQKNTVSQLATKIEAISQMKSDQVRRDEKLDTIKRYHINESEFQHAYPNQSLYDVLEDNKLHHLLHSIFGENQYQPHPETYTRGIDTRKEKNRDLTSFQPLAFHLDTVYHEPTDKFAINFWVPLEDDCGNSRPGLQVAPMDHITIRRIIGFNPQSGFRYSEPTIDESPWSTENIWKRIIDGNPDCVIWRPTCSMGDVLIMTSWIPHASYTHNKMKLPRRSVELRYHGNALDPLPVTIHSLNEVGMSLGSRASYHAFHDHSGNYVRIKELRLDGHQKKFWEKFF